jgi:hypothetical protein
MNDSNEIINRYVYAVTKRLPVKQREDIGQEIRSLIDDMLQDSYPEQQDNTEQKYSPECVIAVLNELGNPYDLAAKYRDNKRSLIGPEYFETYLFVLKIVLAAVTGGLLIALTIKNIVGDPIHPTIMVIEMVRSLVSALFNVFAWVTIIFALIGHYGEDKIDKAIEEVKKEIKWTLEDLPEIPSQKAVIKKGEPIAGMIFGLIGFILFNYAPQALSIISFDNGVAKSVPILNIEGIASFILIINMIIFIGFIKEIAQLLEGRHTMRLSIATALISSITLILSVYLITSPDFINPNFAAEMSTVFGEGTFDGFAVFGGFQTLVKVIIGFSIFGFIVETIGNFYKSLAFSSDKKS